MFRSNFFKFIVVWQILETHIILSLSRSRLRREKSLARGNRFFVRRPVAEPAETCGGLRMAFLPGYNLENILALGDSSGTKISKKKEVLLP